MLSRFPLAEAPLEICLSLGAREECEGTPLPAFTPTKRRAYDMQHVSHASAEARPKALKAQDKADKQEAGALHIQQPVRSGPFLVPVG